MKRLLVIVGLLLIAAGGLGYSYWPEVSARLGVDWMRPRREPVLRLSGVVETQEVRLGSKIGGRVAEVHVAEGAVVEKDESLVSFEAPELQAQLKQWEARLAQAEADRDKALKGPRPEEIEAARLAVDAARERWKRLEAGPRAQDIEQARYELESADVNLKLARQRSERLDRIRAKDPGAVGVEELETAHAEMQRCQSLVNKARSYLEMLLEGTRPEEKAEAQSLVHQSKATYDMLVAGTRAEDKAAAEARVIETRGKVDEIRANLSETVVRAPDRVLVEVLAARRGDLIAPNHPIVRALRADDLWIRIYVPETELGHVRLGQEVEVRIDSFPDRTFRGTVTQIGSQSEFTPRNVQSVDERHHEVFSVKVRVADANGIFKSGMAAEVTLPLTQ